MPEPLPKPAQPTRQAAQLFEKLRRGEKPTANEIGTAQLEVSKAVANKLFREEGIPDFEVVLRNPLVLFQRMSLDEYDTFYANLDETHQKKLLLASETVKAVLCAVYGPYFDQHVPERSDDAHKRFEAPLSVLLSIIAEDNLPQAAQQYLALVVRDLGLLFSEAMRIGEKENWAEATNPDRLDYYAGNAAAGAKFVPNG